MQKKKPACGAGLPRVLVLIGLISATPVPSAADAAPDGPSIEALQQQIRALQKRVDRLEATIQQGVPVNPAQTVQPVPGGWKKEANWNLLSKGMTTDEVSEILGEPQRRRSVNKFEFWEYGDGLARLYLRRLKSWEIPTGIDTQPNAGQ
jgi:hypothetical protein